MNISCSQPINNGVNRGKAIVALLLAMIYLPATGHCLLEQAGWLSPGGDCCEQTASADGSQNASCPYGCCPIEKAVYFSASGNAASTVIAEIPVCMVIVVLPLTANEPHLISPDTSPPILPNAWQFSFRTALPPRAPSFVS